MGVALGRSVSAVLAGVVAALALVLAIEMIGLPLFPQPSGMDPRDPQSVRAHLSAIHPGSFVMVLVAWTAAAFAGPRVARRVAGHAAVWPSLVVAGLFATLCAYNLFVVPTPTWMLLTSLVVVPVATWLGLRRTTGAA